jgi:ABC-type Fe3+ transport system permease subunit
MNSVAVSVLAAFALCVLAVSLAMLVVPSIAWAEVFEYLTMQPPCKGPGV